METTTQFSNGVTSSPFTGYPIHVAARAIFATLGSIMIVCGVTGNWLLISVVFTNFKKLRKRYAHNLFIVNLALADFLTLGYWLTFFVFDLILGYHPVAGPSHCIANGMIVATLFVVSTTSLVTISLNRYLHVCHSHLYNRVFTLPRTVCFCFLIWLFGILVALPPVFGAKAGSYHYNPETRICSYNRDKVTYPKVTVIVLTVVPMICVGYWNFAIFRFWKKAKMSMARRYPMSPRKQHEHEKSSDSCDCQAIETSVGRPKSDKYEVSLKIRAKEFSYVHDTTVTDIDRSESQDSDDQSSAEYYGNETNIEDIQSEGSCMNGKENEKKPRNKSVPISSYLEESYGSEPREVDQEAEAFGEKKVVQVMENQLDRITTDVVQNINEPTLKLHGQHTGEVPERGKMTVTGASASLITEAPTSPSSTLKPQACSQSQKYPNTTFQRLKRERKKQKGREQAFVRSLFVVCLLMFLSFIPYSICITVDSFVAVPPEVAIAGTMLIFLNNAVNWIVYGVMNIEFRKGYVEYLRRLLTACCHWKRE